MAKSRSTFRNCVSRLWIRLWTFWNSLWTYFNDLSRLRQSSQGQSAKKPCRRCQKLDFVSVFYPKQPFPPFNGRYVQARSTLQSDADCPVCLFLATLVFKESAEDVKGYHLRLFSAAKLFGAFEPASLKTPVAALAVFPGRANGEISPWMRRHYPNSDFALIKPRGGISSQRLVVEGASVRSDQVNYGQISSWLKECDRRHYVGPCRYNGQDQPSYSVSLKCIDCHSRAVVEIRPNDEYLTLSYVWGNSTAPPLTEDDLVPKPTTQVIEDAMEVVRRLGKQYLWVDQYTLEQKDHSIKDVQISEMDRIYAGALATIVAAAGSDANHGLPGVSRERFHRQPSIVTGDLEICSSMPPLPYALRDTVWLRRGWTYQEAVLSRRCIFFTEYQIYFMCRGMSRCEAVIVQPPEGWPKSQLPLSEDMNTLDTIMFQGGYRSLKGSPLRKFTNHIQEYSGRTLTHESDMLPAFSGLLARAPFSTFAGIPILPRYRSVFYEGGLMTFAIGLWWHPVYSNQTGKYTSLTRRHHFPSWTWAGWKGPVEYPGEHGIGNTSTTGDFMGVNTCRFDIQFLLEDTKQNISTLEDALDGTWGTHVAISPTLYTLVLHTKVFQLRFQPKLGADRQVCLCKCHPQATHDGPVAPADWWQDAVFIEQPGNTKDARYQRMIRKQWDCVLLFESKSEHQCLIIVERRGDKDERVGSLQVGGRGKSLGGLRSLVRRVRMG